MPFKDITKKHLMINAHPTEGWGECVFNKIRYYSIKYLITLILNSVRFPYVRKTYVGFPYIGFSHLHYAKTSIE